MSNLEESGDLNYAEYATRQMRLQMEKYAIKSSIKSSMKQEKEDERYGRPGRYTYVRSDGTTLATVFAIVIVIVTGIGGLIAWLNKKRIISVYTTSSSPSSNSPAPNEGTFSPPIISRRITHSEKEGIYKRRDVAPPASTSGDQPTKPNDGDKTGGDKSGGDNLQVVESSRTDFKAMCPSPYRMLSIGTTGRFNCYEPCAEGFEETTIEPREGTDEFAAMQYGEAGGVATGGKSDLPDTWKYQPYLACIAKCPPGKQSATPNACKREAIRRAQMPIGTGTAIVKCGWADISKIDHWVKNGKRDTISYTSGGPGYPCTGQFPIGFHDTECRSGRELSMWPLLHQTSWLAERAKSAGNPDEYYLADPKKTAIDSNVPFCSNVAWFKKHVDSDGIDGSVWRMTAPIGCGTDYELIPSDPSAYFTQNMTGSDVSQNGWGWNAEGRAVGYRGMACAKMCPAGKTLIPTGPKELSAAYCAEPCPINTRVNEVDLTQCTKDGYKRRIRIYDMQNILDSSTAPASSSSSAKKPSS